MSWQRKARLLVALAALAVAIAVAVAYRRAPTTRPRGSALLAPADPTALVESGSGFTIRTNREKEEVRIEYKTFTTYPDGPTKLQGVKVTTERASGRTFVVTGNYAEVAQNETNISLVGDVRLTASDGLEARAERATYTETDGLLRAPGAIEFSRGRLHGSALGFTYAKNADVLTLHERTTVHVFPDDAGAGGADIAAGAAEFDRANHVIRFTGGMAVKRGEIALDADSGVARLTADEQRIAAVDLRGRARMTVAGSGAGGLRAIRGQGIDLTYHPDGETLQRAVVTGEASAHVGVGRGRSDRVIAADALDVSLAPDGSTPTAMKARGNIRLDIPADDTAPARVIRAKTLDGRGEPGRGLTHARFDGGVEFTERGAGVNRLARAGALDAAFTSGMSEIEEARFEQRVHFEEGALRAAAAAALYDLKRGTLELTGTEPALPTPQVVNETMSVYSTRLDVTLAGPIVKAAGAVKSELKPPKQGAKQTADARMPSLFKSDRSVSATAGELLYDGPAATATYSANAQLWQGDTSIKADSIALDEKRGDLTARGSVVTTIVLEEKTEPGRSKRVPTSGSSAELQYEEQARRATYLGDAQIDGSQGRMKAAKIELFLTESGDALERAEAYEAVTLRDANWEIKGTRMTYFTGDERYVVTGAPVVITDQCGRETTGRRVTYVKRSDTISVDGSDARTQTRGGSTCR